MSLLHSQVYFTRTAGPLLSAYSDLQYSGDSMDKCGLVQFQGTSMSTPAVSGAAVLVRQYFQRGFHPTGGFKEGVWRHVHVLDVCLSLTHCMCGRVRCFGAQYARNVACAAGNSTSPLQPGCASADSGCSSSRGQLKRLATDYHHCTGAPVASDAFEPEAALVRAVLLGGAEDMVGYATRNSKPLGPTPNQDEGFGRLNLQRSLPLAGDESAFTMQVCGNGLPCLGAGGLEQLVLTRLCSTHTNREPLNTAPRPSSGLGSS